MAKRRGESGPAVFVTLAASKNRRRCYGQPHVGLFRDQRLDTCADVDAAHVTFASASFDQEDAMDNRVASGFVPTQTTLFIWEGVTMYLTADGVA